MAEMTEIAKRTFSSVTECGFHPIDFTEAVVFSEGFAVEVAGETVGDFAEADSYAIIRLGDGRYLVLEEWSDTTGHGCQCDGTAETFDSLTMAVRALTREHRDQAIAARPDLTQHDVER